MAGISNQDHTKRAGARHVVNAVRQKTAHLSQSLPVLGVEDIPEQTGTPVITFNHVTKIYAAQPNKPALDDVSLLSLIHI